MPANITPNSRIPFGRRGRGSQRGRKLGDCTDSHLKWITSNLTDTDLHAWAVAARAVLDARAVEGKIIAKEKSLEAQADSLLRCAGFGYLAKGGRRRKRK